MLPGRELLGPARGGRALEEVSGVTGQRHHYGRESLGEPSFWVYRGECPERRERGPGGLRGLLLNVQLRADQGAKERKLSEAREGATWKEERERRQSHLCLQPCWGPDTHVRSHVPGSTVTAAKRWKQPPHLVLEERERLTGPPIQ